MSGNIIEKISGEEFNRRCMERLKAARQKTLEEAKTPEERKILEEKFRTADNLAKYPSSVNPE